MTSSQKSSSKRDLPIIQLVITLVTLGAGFAVAMFQFNQWIIVAHTPMYFAVGYLLYSYYKRCNELLSYKTQYEEILHSVTEVYCKTNRGFIEVISPSVEQMLGYQPEELVGKRFHTVLLNPKEEEFMKSTLESTAGLKDIRVNFLSKNKEVVPGLLKAEAIFDENGEHNGSVGTIRDISSIVESESMTKQTLDRFKTLYNQTPAMLHSIDHEGKIISVSDYWLEVMGYERHEVIGKKSSDFLTEESREYANNVVLPNFFKTGESQNIYYQMVTKDGRILDIMLDATSFRDHKGKFLRSHACLLDITPLKKAEKKFRKVKHCLPQLVR